MLGNFARNALKKSSTGHTYYTGLSLTHTHTQYANGNTEKKPIEISLCVDPRRDDCRIIFVSDTTEVDKTRLLTYKASKKIFKMSDIEVQNASVSENTTASEQSKDTSKQSSTKEQTAVEPDITSPDQKEMMRVIVMQEEQLAEFEKLKKQVAEEKKKAMESARAKSEAMAKALVESWSNTLDQSDLTDENRQSIIDIAKKFPQESQEFFRVAHHASKKFQQREQKLKEELEATKNADLKKSFNAVMSKTTHAASEKAKTREQTERAHFMDAMNKYRVSGSGRSLMEEVAQIGNIKKRRMY
jgi:hypothetical protein